VDGNRLIVTPGGSDSTVVALDKRNGNLLWKSAIKDGAAYSSPIVFELGGVRQYSLLTASAAVGVNASTGELLWRYDKVSNRTANIATPIYHDGHLFVSTDYGTGCALLKIAPDSGKATEVYFNREMKNHYSSSVLVGKHLYGFSSQVLTAMNFMTGEVAWKDRSVGKGSVTYADGNLYVFGEQGKVALVEATPDGYREKGQFSVPQGEFFTWTPPVIANGRMYLREQDNLYSYQVK
ncbi:MAG TPA: PQQ-binding-like beta-propeller repeat protein, partial [Bryobacteraceae bacterium]|nr:PQQ-binding-like beta-propeller repeat protein [Bryobacteraceae bacterium]